MSLPDTAAALVQFLRPEGAYRTLVTGSQSAAIGGAALLITAIGFLPFLFLGGMGPGDGQIPFLILLERGILAGAGGLAAYALAYALGERKPLWPAVSSCFLSMGAFMILVGVLTFISYMISLPPGFTWSPAELLGGVSATRLGVFLFLFSARLDLASLTTVYLWGRGLSVVWNTDRSTGQRMAWAVYLFGILLVTLPVFIAEPGVEGAS
jgi:hypothetical protein